MELTAAIYQSSYGKWQSEHHPPPSQPAPLYEDIVTSTVKGEVELQLRDNVAYGQVKKVVIYSFWLNCSQQRVTTVINT